MRNVRIKKHIFAGALLLGLSLPTGCGAGEPERVSDYGMTEARGSSEEKGSQEEGSTDRGSEGSVNTLPETKNDGEIIYSDTFTLGGKPVEIAISSIERDTDLIRLYQVSEITGDRIYEEKVAENLFGDTAKKVETVSREPSSGDSLRIFSRCSQFYTFYHPGQESEAVPAWEDGEDYFWHTYEGTYNGVEFQLMIAFRREMKTKYIFFFPKNPGDTVGRPNCTEFWTFSGNREDGVIGEMMKQPNQTRKSEDTLLREAEAFTKDMLCSGMPAEDMYISYEVGGERLSEQLLFLPETVSLGDDSTDPAEGLVDGYAAKVNWTHMGQLEEYLDYSGNNLGEIFITDHGVVGVSLLISYEMEKELGVADEFLSFDRVMESLKEEMLREFDASKINGSVARISSARLMFYPAPAPENPGEATFVPAWFLWVDSNSGIAQIYMNALDGSLLRIDYVR